MAKIIPMDLVKSMTGNICGHSDISFAKKGETQYTMKRCNERTSEPSAAELANQANFKAAHEAVNALTPEQKSAYAEAFKKQTKYSTLRGYMFAQEYAKIAGE